MRAAIRAGRAYVADNWGEAVTADTDLQSEAMDLAAGTGLDADYIYEGMRREQDKRAGKAKKETRNG